MAAATINVPASILSGKGLCEAPQREATPSISTMSVPCPLILAPIFFKNSHKSIISGSFAAFSILVVPSANVAAIIIFSVPVTDFVVKIILVPLSLFDLAWI